jgi:hypothetical protein
MYPDVPFVNRDDELKLLEIKRDQTGPRVHVICGRSGIGKSELARKFADSCENDGFPTLYYQIKDPPSEKIFMQRLLADWFDKYPKSTANQLREYVFSSESVTDILGIIRRAVPEPTSSLAIDSLQQAISGASNADADFPDPVPLVTDIMKQQGSPDQPAVVIIDQYEARLQESERSLESTFRDVAYHLDDSVVWYITSNAQVPAGEVLECFQLEPFDQELVPNPGASYPEDNQPFEPVEATQEQGYRATRALIEEAGFEYEESDLVALHDRTNGVPLLIAAICEEPRAFSLRDELEDTPTNYNEFKTDIQKEFIRNLTENQREILKKTSVSPVLTGSLCVKRTGLSKLEIRQELDHLTEQGKLLQINDEYPIIPAYKCHDFYREYLIECAGLVERELRLETAIDCLLIALDNFGECSDSEVDDVVAVQLDRFIYQLSHIEGDRPISEISELVITGISKSEEEITELIGLHLGYGHRDYGLEDYLQELI